jgi:hypothetical protein
MGESRKPWKLGEYNGLEVASALRKSIKLGDGERAIYWLHVLQELGGKPAQTTAARQLWIVAAEVWTTRRWCSAPARCPRWPGRSSRPITVLRGRRDVPGPKWWESSRGARGGPVVVEGRR